MKKFIKNHKIFSTLIILILIAVIFFVSVLLIHIYWYKNNTLDIAGHVTDIMSLTNDEMLVKIDNMTIIRELNISDETVLFKGENDERISKEDIAVNDWIIVKYSLFNKDEILWIKVFPRTSAENFGK